MGVRVRLHRNAYWLFINHQRCRKARRVGVGSVGKKAAELAAVKLAARLAEGDTRVFDPPPPRVTAPTFAEVAQRWLDQYPKLHAIRESTVENYRSFTNRHLVPFFGTMPIDAVTPEVIEGFIVSRRGVGGAVRGTKGLADATLRVGLQVLYLILRAAVKRRLIRANPWHNVEWRSAPYVAHPDPFTPAELHAILGVAEPIDRDLATMLRVWAQSGARAGEIFGLHPEDVDLERGTILIRRTLTRGRAGPTKTGHERLVSFLHPVTETTREWRPGLTPDCRAVLAQLRKLAVQPIDPTGLLFTHNGSPWDTQSCGSAWRRVLARARIRYRRPEVLRHSCASILLSRNAPLLYVSRLGGWRSARVLLDVYAQWLPTEAGEGVGDSVTQRPNATPAQPSIVAQRAKPGNS